MCSVPWESFGTGCVLTFLLNYDNLRLIANYYPNLTPSCFKKGVRVVRPWIVK